MTQPHVGRLAVAADLQLEVDGTAATLTGDGDHLVLRSDSPAALWDAISGAALPAGIGRVDGPRAVGLVGDALRESGLRLDVDGPHGTLARLGAGVDSRLGRVSTGSRAVQPGSPSALAPLVWHRLRQDVRLQAGAGALALAAAGAVVAVLTRRGRRD